MSKEAIPGRVTVALLVALAGCTPPTDGQKRPNSQQPGLSDISDCRAQARRQAEQYYPHRTSPRGAPLADYATNDADRFPAELSLFRQCMQGKGYEVSS